MADLTVTLPSAPEVGSRVFWGPLPEGDWVAPEGWALEGGYLVARWSRGQATTFVVREVPDVPCGLCGLPIDADDVTISRAGLLSPQAGAPDAHSACYLRAVAEKVSRPGGPASPYADPGPTPTTPAWVPNLAVKVGELYTFGGVTWRVLQAHTTQTSWTPPAVPALWVRA